MTNNSPIFIVGMPRSGTTLMRYLLSAHPRIAIAPETHFINGWVEKYHHLDLRRIDDFGKFWKHFSASEQFLRVGVDAEAVLYRIQQKGNPNFRLVFEAVLEEYASVNNKTRWGEKTPAHYDYVDILLSWFPSARIIWMIRDPRAIVASYMDVPWWTGHVLGPVRRWRTSMCELQRWTQEPRVKIVRYEDLVSNKEKIISDVFKYLGEKVIDESKIFHRRKNVARTGELLDEWTRQHYRAAQGPVHARSLDKWKGKLSQRQIRIVEYVARHGMKRWDYRISSTWNPILIKFEFLVSLFNYLIVLEKKRRLVGGIRWRLRQYRKRINGENVF